jgi:thioredoxin-related protein
MKHKQYISILALGICSFFLSFTFPPGESLALNSAIPMPEYKMKDISGDMVTLSKSKKEKGLLVIFSCNTCPYVKLSASRIKEYSDYCLANNIGCILVNSNEAQRAEEDSFEEMVKYYNSQKLKCCYAVDEKSQLADAFGARTTPQCFLFDNKGLVYKGAIDDNVKDPQGVKEFFLKDAINAVIKGQKPTKQETKSIGCTIKRLD